VSGVVECVMWDCGMREEWGGVRGDEMGGDEQLSSSLLCLMNLIK